MERFLIFLEICKHNFEKIIILGKEFCALRHKDFFNIVHRYTGISISNFNKHLKNFFTKDESYYGVRRLSEKGLQEYNAIYQKYNFSDITKLVLITKKVSKFSKTMQIEENGQLFYNIRELWYNFVYEDLRVTGIKNDDFDLVIFFIARNNPTLKKYNISLDNFIREYLNLDTEELIDRYRKLFEMIIDHLILASQRPEINLDLYKIDDQFLTNNEINSFRSIVNLYFKNLLIDKITRVRDEIENTIDSDKLDSGRKNEIIEDIRLEILQNKKIEKSIKKLIIKKKSLLLERVVLYIINNYWITKNKRNNIINIITNTL